MEINDGSGSTKQQYMELDISSLFHIRNYYIGWFSCGRLLHMELVHFGNGYFGTTAVSSVQEQMQVNIGIFEYDVYDAIRRHFNKGLNE